MINERKFRKVMRGMPSGVGRVMLRYVQRNFASESYRGSAWQPRRNQGNNRKPLLVDTGKLKASFKVREASWRVIRVGSDRQAASGNAHLAQLHNEGAQGVATVRTYTRRGRNGSVRVRSHRRHAHLPQRQFMPIPGTEPLPPELWAAIENFVSVELDKVFK
ncbi:phage virion morphogenesis protein [Microscilla marina]|nr:phage virion morphogenesis protein [Microscilla marina]